MIQAEQFIANRWKKNVLGFALSGWVWFNFNTLEAFSSVSFFQILDGFLESERSYIEKISEFYNNMLMRILDEKK